MAADDRKSWLSNANSSLASLGRGSSLGIVSRDLNFHPHVVLGQSGHANTRPQGLVIGHPLLQVAHHGLFGLPVEREVVGVNSKHLLPALAPGVLQGSVDVAKGQINLSVDFLFENPGVRIPATWAGNRIRKMGLQLPY